MAKKNYLITKFAISGFMAIIGIMGIWYLEDIRMKMFSMIVLIWEGFYWYSKDYTDFNKLKEERK